MRWSTPRWVGPVSPDPFVHLHVASGYSLQYGASHPHVLVDRAAEQEMDTLALTDRDGTYGAVKFAKACLRGRHPPGPRGRPAYHPGMASADGRRPAQPGESRRNPVRGGAFRDERLPRVTLLAHAGTHGGQAGWAAICRLVSATHLAGERGRPVATLDLLAPHLAGGDVVVLLGPASELGNPVARRRDDLALVAARPLARGGAAREPPRRAGLPSTSQCRRRLGPRQLHPRRPDGRAWPGRPGVGTVLTNAVRYADRLDAPVVDVLDAARRLVPLDRRHVDRANAEGFMKSGKQMHEIAEEICRLSGLGRRRAVRPGGCSPAPAPSPTGAPSTPAATSGSATVHFPEFHVTAAPAPQAPECDGADEQRRRSRLDAGLDPGAADGALRARCEEAIEARYADGPRR